MVHIIISFPWWWQYISSRSSFCMMQGYEYGSHASFPFPYLSSSSELSSIFSRCYPEVCLLRQQLSSTSHISQLQLAFQQDCWPPLSSFLSSQTFSMKCLQMSTTKAQAADGSVPDGLAINFLAGKKAVPFWVSLSFKFLGNPEERGWNATGLQQLLLCYKEE